MKPCIRTYPAWKASWAWLGQRVLMVCLLVGTGSSLMAQVHMKVYVFLGENCVISRHYTALLRELHGQYADQGVQFLGVFPNGYSTEAGIAAFQEKYLIPFGLQKDSAQVLTRRFQATVTPEVVVWDEESQSVRYQGRLDDQYARVGRRRLQPTQSELVDVLAAWREDRPIAVAHAPAVGCFITQIPACK